MLRIALDGMGGDHAPVAMVEGAVQCLDRDPELNVVLVGKPEALEPELARLSPPPGRITIHPASQVAGMDEAPGHVLRHQRDASIRVAFDLHKAGQVDAVVSAGNSGATMAVGMVVMGRLPEVDRPALASVFPGLSGPTVVLDVGANVDCSPLMLLQFAYMGAAYAERVVGLANPAVGLMSIGEEGGKGNHVVKQAYEYLKNSGLNFIGNVEGRDLFAGPARVVVCDGFVGNVCLKLAEGMFKALSRVVKERVAVSLTGRLGALLLKPTLSTLAKDLDYENYGGAPLLGINGVAFVCHGASTPKAIASALVVAAASVRGRVAEHVADGLAQYRGRLLGDNGAGERE
ncbi:MAG: phosphate acyltransferase PlsX [Desulfarculus sp.]|nr:phosphate acyltransferase PlsX [Desulfarculus sp.]